MDAALSGLAGTAVGALAGVAGSWLAQRGQLRLHREQRTYEERRRWLDEKRTLYRDMLIAMYGWHDALVSYWENGEAEKLFETRTAASMWSIETSLIASNPVRSAIDELYVKFYAAQLEIFAGKASDDADPPLTDVLEALGRLENALRVELSPLSPRALRRFDDATKVAADD